MEQLPSVPWDVQCQIFLQLDAPFVMQTIRLVSRRCRDWVNAHVGLLLISICLFQTEVQHRPTAEEMVRRIIWLHLPKVWRCEVNIRATFFQTQGHHLGYWADLRRYTKDGLKKGNGNRICVAPREGNGDVYRWKSMPDWRFYFRPTWQPTQSSRPMWQPDWLASVEVTIYKEEEEKVSK